MHILFVHPSKPTSVEWLEAIGWKFIIKRQMIVVGWTTSWFFYSYILFFHLHVWYGYLYCSKKVASTHFFERKAKFEDSIFKN